MSIYQILFVILATASLSSLLTLGVVYFFIQAFLKKRLQKDIKEAAGLIKEQLHKGVLEAGQELLPDFRNEVSSGFTEALSRALSGDIIPQTARHLAKNSQGLVEQGLSFLLGRPSAPEEEKRKEDKEASKNKQP